MQKELIIEEAQSLIDAERDRLIEAGEDPFSTELGDAHADDVAQWSIVTAQTEQVVYDVPTISGQPQAQGDLMILPWQDDVQSVRRAQEISQAKVLPAAGHVVLLGDDGHAHLLKGDNKVMWYRYPGDMNQTLGLVHVEEGGLAVLGHEEHGDSLIGAGTYIIRRQRELWSEIRLVND